MKIASCWWRPLHIHADIKFGDVPETFSGRYLQRWLNILSPGQTARRLRLILSRQTMLISGWTSCSSLDCMTGNESHKHLFNPPQLIVSFLGIVVVIVAVFQPLLQVTLVSILYLEGLVAQRSAPVISTVKVDCPGFRSRLPVLSFHVASFYRAGCVAVKVALSSIYQNYFFPVLSCSPPFFSLSLAVHLIWLAVFSHSFSRLRSEK